MKRIPPALIPKEPLKDASGAYVKESPGTSPTLVTPDPPTADIDSMLQRGLAAIDRLMRVITMDISTGAPSRETVMNLKDAMGMLESLKKREAELLDTMSEEELQAAAKHER